MQKIHRLTQMKRYARFFKWQAKANNATNEGEKKRCQAKADKVKAFHRGVYWAK